MSESQVEVLLRPEASRELVFGKVTRFNPIFWGTLPFNLGTGGNPSDLQSFDLKEIGRWVRGADREADRSEAMLFGRRTSSRSLILPVRIQDKKQRVFGCLDFKGGGLTLSGSREGGISDIGHFVFNGRHADPEGACYLSNCEYEFDQGVDFDRLGARVGVPVMVLELSDQDPGVQALLKRNPHLETDFKDDKLGVVVRAFRSPYRFDDLWTSSGENAWSETEKRWVNRDVAIEAVVRNGLELLEGTGLMMGDLPEISKNSERLSLYLRSVAFVGGLTLGRLHEHGYWVGNRSRNNLTAAGEEVDLGDGADVKGWVRRKWLKDWLIFSDVFEHGKLFELDDYLWSYLGDPQDKDKYIKSFLYGYKVNRGKNWGVLIRAMTKLLDTHGLGGYEKVFLSGMAGGK